MARRPKAQPIPEAWEVARKVTRTDVMPSRVHGQRSRRTERRKGRQELRRGMGEE
jgi:hypothetical protein